MKTFDEPDVVTLPRESESPTLVAFLLFINTVDDPLIITLPRESESPNLCAGLLFM